MFLAAPALAPVGIGSYHPTRLGRPVLRSITAALRHGALLKLLKLQLSECVVGDGDVKDFMDALEESGCVKQLAILNFPDCRMVEGRMHPLADVLCRDAFPPLKELSLLGNGELKDEGVVATQTSLTKLNLRSADIGNESVTAIASFIYAGRMGQLKEGVKPV